MGEFGDALQGYQQGANNSLQIQEQNLNRPTPVQAFLQQLRSGQEMGIQQQQAQGLMAYRDAMVNNQSDRGTALAQHYQDQANNSDRRASIAEARNKASEDLQGATLAVKQAQQKVQAGVAGATIELLQAKTKEVTAEANVKQVYGPAEAQSVIAKNQALTGFLGTRDTNAQNPSYDQVRKQLQVMQHSWGLLPYNQRGPMPTIDDADAALKSIAPGANAVPPSDTPPDPPATGPGSSLGVIPPMPVLPSVLPSMGTPQALPQADPTQEALKRPNGNPMLKIVPPQEASVDPLHGQFSTRTPGLYGMNGNQYLVDGSGMINALGGNALGNNATDNSVTGGTGFNG